MGLVNLQRCSEWPLADGLLTAWAGRKAAAETVEVDYLRFEDVFGDIWSVAAAPFSIAYLDRLAEYPSIARSMADQGGHDRE
jgi:hypothetical protein